MVDYKKAFQAGLEAAKTARDTKREIQQLIDQFDAAVRESSDGRIGIRREEIPAPSAHVFGPIVQVRPTDLWLVAFNPTSEPETRENLAKCEMSERGYPVELRWRTRVCECNDRESLEAALRELLEDSVTGEKLLNLMSPESQAT
jgi:hypothetical protein